MNEKIIADNKKFWETIEPLLSDKIKSSNMFPVESDEIINEVDRNLNVLNSCFNAVTDLIMSEFSGTDPRADSSKYRKHLSIDAIKNITTGKKLNF